jgi:uncharacterized membrane protein YgdD (TMEM256/DUF423 family)
MADKNATMRWTVLGAFSAFCAVAFGAFGAHALKDRLEPAMLKTFEVGVRYQMYHALALIAVGLLSHRDSGVSRVGWFFAVGTVLFSGSLYGLSLTGLRFFGPITPIGGVCFLLGWAMLAWRLLRAERLNASGNNDGQ